MKKIMIGLLTLLVLSSCAVGLLSQPPSKHQVAKSNELGTSASIAGVHATRNSANGIDVFITYKNINPSKTIKYADFTVEFLNDVGDVVSHQFSQEQEISLRSTGPVRPGELKLGGYTPWELVFYHPNASKVVVTSVEVEFMDGTKEKKVGLKVYPEITGNVFDNY